MLIFGKIIGLIIVSLSVNFLLNSLPSIRDFPGKNWLIVRQMCWLTYISSAQVILGSETSDAVKAIFRYGIAAAFIALIYENITLVAIVYLDPKALKLFKSPLFYKRVVRISLRIKYFLTSKLFRASAIVISTCLFAMWLNTPLPKSRKDLLDILFSNAESIAIASAAILFFIEIPARRKQDRYNAWQFIDSGAGQLASGGRAEALEDLNRDGANLEGLSFSGVDLSGVKLVFGRLKHADFSETQLDSADLSYASLIQSNLVKANLEKANMVGADLTSAILSGATLKDAVLTGANLTGATLKNAKLEGANLLLVQFRGADLTGADLSRAKNLTETQLSDAILCRTILPESVDHTYDSPNRNIRLNGDPPND